MIGSDNQKKPESIAGDRRTDRRYDIHLELRWKLIRRRRLLDTGVGHTVDLSSGGILFDAGRQLPVGLNVELSVSWPVLLHNAAPLQLVVSARIVRSAGNRAGVRMVQHEFRTVAVVSEHHTPINARSNAPAALFSNRNRSLSLGNPR